MDDKKRSIPDWVLLLLDFLSPIVGAIWGARIAEKEHEKHEAEEKESPWRRAGKKVGDVVEQELKADRADLEQEFLRCGAGVKAIQDLLTEANIRCGITVPYKFKTTGRGGREREQTVEKPYSEHWIVKRLLSIPNKKNRRWVYERLNRVLEEDGRPAFFGLLEILNNDGHWQFMRWLGRVVAGEGRRVIAFVGNTLATVGSAVTSPAVQFVALVCLIALALGAAVVVLGPIPLLVIGIVSRLGWLVAMVWIFWTLATLLCMFIGTPLGVLVESLIELISPTPRVQRAGRWLNPFNWIPNILGILSGGSQRWVSAVKSILLVETTFAFFVAVFARYLHNNYGAIPMIFLAAALVGLVGGKTGRGWKFVKSAAVFVIVFLALSFLLPRFFGKLDGYRDRVDRVLSGEETISLGTSQAQATPPRPAAPTPQAPAPRPVTCQPPPPPPQTQFTVGCEGDAIDLPRNVRQVELLVQPCGDGYTQWVNHPRERIFYFIPEGQVITQWQFYDGTFGFLKPSSGQAPVIEDRYITRARFVNNGPEPVRVALRLQY